MFGERGFEDRLAHGHAVLGTYVSRIFQETKQRPLYVVREVTRPAGERE